MKLSKYINVKKILNTLSGSAFLVVASLLGNVLNFLYNAYLGRILSVEAFGLTSLFSSFVYLIQVPLSSLPNTTTQQSAYIFGKSGHIASSYWQLLRKKTVLISIISSLIWLAATPILAHIFQSNNVFSFLLFTPVLFVSFLAAVDGGFLMGSHKFLYSGILIISEAAIKLMLAIFFHITGQYDLVFAAIPLSMVFSFILGWLGAHYIVFNAIPPIQSVKYTISKKYLLGSAINKLAGIAFLGSDVVLAKLLLTPTAAGQYALLSLVGKMVYFFGSLLSTLIIPHVGKALGANSNSKDVFKPLFIIISIFSLFGYVVFGVLGHIFVPLLFGQRTLPIIPLLPIFCLGLSAYTIATAIVLYYQALRNHLYSAVSLLLSILQITFLLIFHRNIQTFSYIVSLFGLINLVTVVLLHNLPPWLKISIKTNTYAIVGLFKKTNNSSERDKQKILIYNWRDTKHVWAGGAEVYIHELAKRLVKNGHSVTIFCGNDGQCKRNDVIDGVRIIRRGGFYTVYFWAAIYYIFKFRRNFNLIIDSQNGIPFFTPLFSTKPKILLIHRVHQEVFRNHLKFPFAQFAMILESKLMPAVYRNQKVLTISDTSKHDILKYIGFKADKIHVIKPGVDLNQFHPTKKYLNPTFLYLGRLKPYKNVDIAIKSFEILAKKYPKAKLLIAGEGESFNSPNSLAKSLNLQKKVVFLGEVSEKEKVELMAKSWIMIQPSSFEGWGLTVIEANAAGTPVIASNVMGLRESVVHNQTGLLIDEKNPQILAQAMVYLLSNPQVWHKMKNEAIKWSSNFSWDKNANDLEKYIFSFNHFQSVVQSEKFITNLSSV